MAVMAPQSYMPKLVEVCLDMVLNSMKEKEQAALLELLLHLHKQGEVNRDHIVEGLRAYTQYLDDLR